MGDPYDLPAIMSGLLRYLLANSLACDTAEGIRRWWFEAGTPFTEDAVSDALEALVDRHLVEVTTAADGHRRYRRSATDEELAAALAALTPRRTTHTETH